MAARIQSPSSINTYKQCPRKYYYQYIVKLPTVKSIHLLRGGIIHKALENFFKIDVSKITDGKEEFELSVLLHSLFQQEWLNSKTELFKLSLTQDELEFYVEESKEMLNSWFESFLNRIRLKQNNHLTFKESFNLLKPKTEMHLISKNHKVQGYIDAVHEIGDEVTLMDYKTSRIDQISDEYKLQLAIYALLYFEKYGKHPDLVGIDFLKHGPKYIKVDKDLLNLAVEECKIIQEKTISEDVKDYPLNPGPLCKHCDFYDICFGQKKINDF